jgi:hypothetical protein
VINKAVDYYVFFCHAAQDLLNLYYNDPTTPHIRSVVPGSAFALTTGPVWAPFRANWFQTGLLGNFADYLGFRYTFVAIDAGHALAPALREGKSILTGNWVGIEATGDGTGLPLLDPALIFQHFWTNFIERDYATGLWAGVPAFGTYSVLDTTRIAAAATYGATLAGGGLKGAILIAEKGSQVPVFDVTRDMAVSWDLDVGENRHGQIFVEHENPAAVAAVEFNQQDDQVEFDITMEDDAYANVIRYWYGKRYVPPSAPIDTPNAGEPLPELPVAEFSEWLSGMVELPDAAAIAQNEGVREYLDLYMPGVREQATADAIAARVLARVVGPTGSREGAMNGRLLTGWHGLQKDGVDVDLGTVFGMTTIEGLGASGDVGVRYRVREVVVDGAGGVTLKGRRLTG